MAANEYFKLAASYLRRGIEVTKQEINNRRQDIERMKQDSGKEISSIQDQIRRLESDLTRQRVDTNIPGPDRATELRLVGNRQQEISDIQKALMNNQEKVLSEIKEQERVLMDLEQQARRLDVMA